jgi:hypothetical protein
MGGTRRDRDPSVGKGPSLTLPVSLIALGLARLLLTDSWEREGVDYETKGNWKECGRSFLGAAARGRERLADQGPRRLAAAHILARGS